MSIFAQAAITLTTSSNAPTLMTPGICLYAKQRHTFAVSRMENRTTGSHDNEKIRQLHNQPREYPLFASALTNILTENVL